MTVESFWLGLLPRHQETLKPTGQPSESVRSPLVWASMLPDQFSKIIASSAFLFALQFNKYFLSTSIRCAKHCRGKDVYKGGIFSKNMLKDSL